MLVFYIVGKSTIYAPPQTAKKATRPIRASLIFDLPKATIKQPESMMQKQPPVSEEEHAIDTPPIEQKVDSPEAETPPPIKTDVLSKKNSKLMEEKTDHAKATIIHKDRDIFQSRAKSQLQKYNMAQNEQLAVQASKNYQQQKNFPIVDAKPRNPFMTEDEKFMISRQIKTDCSTTGKKTVAMVLGFLGGGVTCSQPPSFDEFIQKRLNAEKQPSSPKETKKWQPVVVE